MINISLCPNTFSGHNTKAYTTVDIVFSMQQTLLTKGATLVPKTIILNLGPAT